MKKSVKLEDGSGIPLRLAEARRAAFGARGKAAMARAIGIKPATYENYERGLCNVPYGILLRVSLVTGWHMRWLALGEGPKGGEAGGMRLPINWDSRVDLDVLNKTNGKTEASILREAPAEYKPGGATTWEVAAILREGKRFRFRRVTDAPPPLGIYSGGEDGGTLD